MEWTPDRIRLFRDAGLSLSQPRFAKQLGFTKRTIGNAERGTHPPSLALRRALDQALEQASDAHRNRFLATVARSQENSPPRNSTTHAPRHLTLQPLTLTNARQLTVHIDDIEQRYEMLVASAGNSAFGWFHAQSSSPGWPVSSAPSPKNTRFSKSALPASG